MSRESGTGTGREPEALVVLVTAPDREVALRLARELVSARAVACVNVVAGVTSVYRWEDRVVEEGEVLLVAKTAPERLADLQRIIAASHPYDVPEVVALRPAAVEERYLAWLSAETREA